MNPPRFVQILHLPIRGIRIVTDPIVDSVVFFVVNLLFPPFKRLLWRLVNLFLAGSLALPKETKGSNITSGIPYLSQLVRPSFRVIEIRPHMFTLAGLYGIEFFQQIPRSSLLLVKLDTKHFTCDTHLSINNWGSHSENRAPFCCDRDAR